MTYFFFFPDLYQLSVFSRFRGRREGRRRRCSFLCLWLPLRLYLIFICSILSCWCCCCCCWLYCLLILYTTFSRPIHAFDFGCGDADEDGEDIRSRFPVCGKEPSVTAGLNKVLALAPAADMLPLPLSHSLSQVSLILFLSSLLSSSALVVREVEVQLTPRRLVQNFVSRLQ